MSPAPVLLLRALKPDQREAQLSGSEHHHLCRVLRLREGAPLELRDGAGLVAQARIVAIERRSARVEILGTERRSPEPGPRLRLALPLLKGRRLDWVLEKATELGVAGLQLYVSRHNVVRKERAPERYAEIVASAYCQCRRLLLPEMDGPVSFAVLLDRAREARWRLWWADERLADAEEAPGGTAPDPRGEHLAWVGPEGGFSEEEREALVAAGARALRLGPTRLRSETAALALACRFLLGAAGGNQPPS